MGKCPADSVSLPHRQQVYAARITRITRVQSPISFACLPVCASACALSARLAVLPSGPPPSLPRHSLWVLRVHSQLSHPLLPIALPPIIALSPPNDLALSSFLLPIFPTPLLLPSLLPFPPLSFFGLYTDHPSVSVPITADVYRPYQVSATTFLLSLSYHFHRGHIRYRGMRDAPVLGATHRQLSWSVRGHLHPRLEP